ncbi:MAG: ATP synthase F1 subunit gamma [Clostridia bacterium]|nr:ATP synthase F1 subunit gamma [Candidatus Pelethousia sp.]NCB30219.1 ATP synthase F1 subunit gamma [Clostridia bacterium]
MQNLNEIRQHIRAVEQTRKLTNAMYLVASSRMKRALPHVEYDRMYFQKVQAAMQEILRCGGRIHHPYLEDRGDARCFYIIVAGDKGMAGDYNATVLNLAWGHIQAHPNSHIATVGVMASRFFRERGVVPESEVFGLPQDPSLENARRLTAAVKDLFDSGAVDRVYLVYTAFYSTVRTRPIVRQILPLLLSDPQTCEGDPEGGPMLYHPSPKAVFDRLVPEYMVSVLFASLVQSYASEHCARMNAMRGATDSADGMLKKLRQQYNMARQAAITREITEISGAAQALRLPED